MKSEYYPKNGLEIKKKSRKIAILEKKKETGILDAFRKSVEFRRGIR